MAASLASSSASSSESLSFEAGVSPSIFLFFAGAAFSFTSGSGVLCFGPSISDKLAEKLGTAGAASGLDLRRAS